MRRSTLKRGMWAAVFMATLAGAGISTASAAAIKYSISPQRTTVAPGQQCTLSVMAVGPGDSLGCVECRITFNPALVTLISGQEGTLFKNAGVPRLFFNSPVAPDTFKVEGCLLGYRTYTLTPGEMARFVFRADAVGVCPVRITRLNVWDINRVLIEPAFEANAWIFIGNATGVRPQSPPGLGVLTHPNPFNPSTTIDLTASAGEHVRLDVYSAAGHLVRHLFDGQMRSDTASFRWDGNDAAGMKAPSGVYFVRAASGESRATHKVVLTR